jgi:hypothetical protein
MVQIDGFDLCPSKGKRITNNPCHSKLPKYLKLVTT